MRPEDTATPKPGDVIQLDPAIHTHHGGFWAGQFAVVTEVTSWGVKCGVHVPKGVVYYRAENGTFAVIGPAIWLPTTDVVEDWNQP